MRWLLGLVGAVAIGYGGYGLLTADRGPEVVGYLVFAVAGVLGQDLVLAPLALALGGLVARFTPPGLRALVVAGLFTSVTVCVIALPFVLGYGRKPDNPSALPLHYGRSLALILLAIWTGVATVGVLRWLATRRRHSSAPTDPPRPR